jgi:hypothetical protein
MNFVFKALFIFLFLISSGLFAQISAQNDKHVGQLQIQKFSPIPSAQILSRWQIDFHEDMPETWIIEDTEEFARIFREGGASQELKAEIDSRVRSQLSGSEILKTFSYTNNPLSSPSVKYTFVQLTPELKAKIPSKILEDVYKYLFSKKLNPRFMTFPSLELLVQDLKAQGNEEAAIRQAMTSSVEVNGSVLLFVWPDLWKKLSYRTKNLIIRSTLADSPSNQGLKIDLILSPQDDLGAIAKKYAGNRNYAVGDRFPYWQVIERYLQKKLKDSNGKSVAVPLENILHPFIRDQMNSFNECTGANCHNSGLSVNEDHLYEKTYLDTPQLLQKRVFPYYDKIYGMDNLQTGDLLIYFSIDNKIIHTATYIGRNGSDVILFTKNGLQKTNAYIFSTQKQVEELYFRGADNQFHLAMYHPKISSNSTNLCSTLMKGAE